MGGVLFYDGAHFTLYAFHFGAPENPFFFVAAGVEYPFHVVSPLFLELLDEVLHFAKNLLCAPKAFSAIVPGPEHGVEVWPDDDARHRWNFGVSDDFKEVLLSRVPPKYGCRVPHNVVEGREPREGRIPQPQGRGADGLFRTGLLPGFFQKDAHSVVVGVLHVSLVCRPFVDPASPILVAGADLNEVSVPRGEEGLFELRDGEFGPEERSHKMRTHVLHAIQKGRGPQPLHGAGFALDLNWGQAEAAQEVWIELFVGQAGHTGLVPMLDGGVIMTRCGRDPIVGEMKIGEVGKPRDVAAECHYALPFLQGIMDGSSAGAERKSRVA